jgi:hypothetical protein
VFSHFEQTHFSRADALRRRVSADGPRPEVALDALRKRIGQPFRTNAFNTHHLFKWVKKSVVYHAEGGGTTIRTQSVLLVRSYAEHGIEKSRDGSGSVAPGRTTPRGSIWGCRTGPIKLNSYHSCQLKNNSI